MWLLTYLSAFSSVPSACATLASDDAKLRPASGFQSSPFPLPGIFYALWRHCSLSLNVTFSERSWCLPHKKMYLSFSFYIPFADIFFSAALCTSNGFYVCLYLCLPRSTKQGLCLTSLTLYSHCFRRAQPRVSAQ